MEERRENARAAGADRVTQRDGASIHVHLCGIDSEFPQHGDGLNRERFVQFKQIHFTDVQPIFGNRRRTASTGVISKYFGGSPLVA